jgi:hypothetical protein
LEMGTVLKSRPSPCDGLTRKIGEAGKALRRLENFPFGERDGGEFGRAWAANPDPAGTERGSLFFMASRRKQKR